MLLLKNYCLWVNIKCSRYNTAHASYVPYQNAYVCVLLCFYSNVLLMCAWETTVNIIAIRFLPLNPQVKPRWDLSSRLWHGPALDVAGIWGMNQGKSLSLLPSLWLLSKMKTHTILRDHLTIASKFCGYHFVTLANTRPNLLKIAAKKCWTDILLELLQLVRVNRERSSRQAQNWKGCQKIV